MTHVTIAGTHPTPRMPYARVRIPAPATLLKMFATVPAIVVPDEEGVATTPFSSVPSLGRLIADSGALASN